MRTIALSAALITCGVSAAFAHPGHGVTEPYTVVHQVVEPVHAIPWGMLLIGSLVAVLAVSARWGQRRRQASSAAAAPQPRTPLSSGRPLSN